jgi:predicted Rossmann-fold nucleotide-binding protein
MRISFGTQICPQPPSLPEKPKMVAVLGGSKQNPDTQPYLEILKLASEKLSAMGYGIITGGSPGANFYGNWGAHPDRSYAIHVRG